MLFMVKKEKLEKNKGERVIGILYTNLCKKTSIRTKLLGGERCLEERLYMRGWSRPMGGYTFEAEVQIAMPPVKAKTECDFCPFLVITYSW